MAAKLKSYLVSSLRQLVTLPADELIEQRYEKFRRMGILPRVRFYLTSQTRTRPFPKHVRSPNTQKSTG